MKKTLLLLVAFISFSTFAQTKTETPSTNKFVTLNYSMSNTKIGETFKDASYPSIEVGFTTKNNVAYSAVFGRGATNGVFEKKDTLKAYYYEAKMAPYYSFGKVTGTVFAGAGGYFDTRNYFTELGVGVSYTIKPLTLGVSFSNFDTRNYVTTSVTYNF